MKVLLIGYGYWGKKIFATLSSIKDIKVLVFDKKNKDLDLEKILAENKNINHVFIATPEETHYQLVKKFILLSKNVFVEKPLCLNKGEAEELVKIAQEKKVNLFVDYIFLYENYLSEIKKLMKDPSLGTLTKVSSERFSSFIKDKKVLISDDLMIHDLYVFRYLLGSVVLPVKINSQYKTSLKNLALTFNLNNGVEVDVHYSYLKDETKRELVLSFTNGKISWIKNEKEELLRFERESMREIIVTNDPSPLEKSIRFFLEGNLEVNRYNDYISDVEILEQVRKNFYEYQSI